MFLKRLESHLSYAKITFSRSSLIASMSQMQPERDAPPFPIPAEDPKADMNKTRLFSAFSGEKWNLAVILP
ncbi:ABC transporter atnG [Fusarium oxysporum f. sp. albedinis]|nr:ABC transporter atnG [Fusarium oxysporum f. sp. albedinis]